MAVVLVARWLAKEGEEERVLAILEQLAPRVAGGARLPALPAVPRSGGSASLPDLRDVRRRGRSPRSQRVGALPAARARRGRAFARGPGPGVLRHGRLETARPLRRGALPGRARAAAADHRRRPADPVDPGRPRHLAYRGGPARRRSRCSAWAFSRRRPRTWPAALGARAAIGLAVGADRGGRAAAGLGAGRRRADPAHLAGRDRDRRSPARSCRPWSRGGSRTGRRSRPGSTPPASSSVRRSRPRWPSRSPNYTAGGGSRSRVFSVAAALSAAAWLVLDRPRGASACPRPDHRPCRCAARPPGRFPWSSR